MVGKIRELVAGKLLTPILPLGFDIGTGKIVDTLGNQSSETDLIIYSRSILPPVLFSERDGVFPCEACYYAIEVKSRLTAANLKDALEKGRSIINLGWAARSSNRIPVVLVLFAFDSDLSLGSSEIERYCEHDSEWDTAPILKAICVAGRGYWYHHAVDNCWVGNPATAEHDEVIDLLSGIVNTMLKNPPYTRSALLGHYLCANRPVQL